MAYPAIADGVESKQLARITIVAKKEKDQVVLAYTRLDGATPKEGQTAKMFLSAVTPELDAAIRALKVGDETVVVKVKKGEFWNFARLEDKATFVAKKAFTPGQGGTYTGKKEKEPYDTAGVKVGAVLHDAVAIAVHNAAGKKVTLEDIKVVARDLMTFSLELETETRVSIKLAAAGGTGPSSRTTNTDLSPRTGGKVVASVGYPSGNQAYDLPDFGGLEEVEETSSDY